MRCTLRRHTHTHTGASTPKPVDSDDWAPGQEAQRFRETLDQIELADRTGFDYIWVAEHHFTPEYTRTSAPDLLLAAASQRTRRIRLGSEVVQMPPAHNHPAREAERIATLDVLSTSGNSSPVQVEARPAIGYDRHAAVLRKVETAFESRCELRPSA